MLHVLLQTFNLVDYIATILAINAGFEEINPIVLWWIDTFGLIIGLTIFKIGIIVPLIAFVAINVKTIYPMVMLNILYGLLTIWHIYGISLWLV